MKIHKPAPFLLIHSGSEDFLLTLGLITVCLFVSSCDPGKLDLGHGWEINL